MQAAAGTSIWGGIAIGRIHVYKRPQFEGHGTGPEDPGTEMERYQTARTRMKEEFRSLEESTRLAAGSESAAIFEFYEEMLDDEGIAANVDRLIREEGRSADEAVSLSFRAAADRFRDIEDPYFRARRDDVLDVGYALVESMHAARTDILPGTEPVILAADDLTPSETARFDRTRILGIVTRQGTPDSHTAILARALNIPALIMCDGIHEDWEGHEAILDGYDSCIYIDPSASIAARLTERHQEDEKEKAALNTLRGQPTVTRDGVKVRLFANISGPQDIGAVEQNDAEGVGLFRSEFVYLRSTEDPSEEMQFQAYRQVVRTLFPRLVIIRTCDIGADKSISYLNFGREVNPALGYRGIRISLSRPDFFKRQLRALLRASAYGRMGIMFPMITGTNEVDLCREYLKTCEEELRREGRDFDENLPVGIMIETPAAVLCADDLAGKVDFFSIGTNDLTQYTLACDRQSPRIGTYIDPHHPAVLREIEMSVEAGHRHNIPVGICGELAADPSLTERFLRMGVDEFSVTPAAVLPLRKAIRSMDLGM